MSQQPPVQPSMPAPDDPTVPAKKKRRIKPKTWAMIAGAVVIFGIGHATAGGSSTPAVSSPAATVTVTVTAPAPDTTHTTAAPAEKTSSDQVVTTIDTDGVYQVGEDVVAGRWIMTVPGGASCSYQVSADKAGASVLTHETVAEHQTVHLTVKNGTWLKTSGCGMWGWIGA